MGDVHEKDGLSTSSPPISKLINFIFKSIIKLFFLKY